MHDHVPELLVKAANPVMLGGGGVGAGSIAGLVFGLAPAEWTVIFGAVGAFCAVAGLSFNIWRWWSGK